MGVPEPATISRPAIEHLVRDVLGCNCAAEVFQQIGTRENVRSPGGLPVSREIRVGGRLLLWILGTDDPGTVVRSLGETFRAGRYVRDKEGFNRFRLVVATDAPAESRRELEEAFEVLPDRDERLHLHVVAARDVRFSGT